MTTNKLTTLSKAGLAAAATLFLSANGLDSKAQSVNQLDTRNAAARLIRYEVKSELQLNFRKALIDYVFYSINEENNIISEAYYEEDKPSVFWIIERWYDKAALNKVNGSIQFKAINELYKSSLIKPAEIFNVKDLEPLSKQQWRSRANKEDKPITIMLFVDSKPGTENSFKEVYHAAMPQFRSEPGVINYQLSEFEDDSTRFVTYEKFRNEDAFEYHLNFPPIEPVIHYLNTSIKKQPFQTGLHRLIELVP